MAESHLRGPRVTQAINFGGEGLGEVYVQRESEFKLRLTVDTPDGSASALLSPNFFRRVLKVFDSRPLSR